MPTPGRLRSHKTRRGDATLCDLIKGWYLTSKRSSPPAAFSSPPATDNWPLCCIVSFFVSQSVNSSLRAVDGTSQTLSHVIVYFLFFLLYFLFCPQPLLFCPCFSPSAAKYFIGCAVVAGGYINQRCQSSSLLVAVLYKNKHTLVVMNRCRRI